VAVSARLRARYRDHRASRPATSFGQFSIRSQRTTRLLLYPPPLVTSEQPAKNSLIPFACTGPGSSDRRHVWSPS